MNKEREDLINGLLALAAFLADNPDAPTPHAPQFDVFLDTKESFAAAAKAIGGKLHKEDYNTVMTLRKEFGPLQYDINVDRELVCERVVVGKQIVAAVEAIPEHEEDVIEWKCGTILS